MYMRSVYCAPTFLDKCTNDDALSLLPTEFLRMRVDGGRRRSFQLVFISALLTYCRLAVIVHNSGVLLKLWLILVFLWVPVV